MKIFFRNIHLYLSLVAGIVIAIVCLTGAILVFEKEWQHTLYPERYTVEPGLQQVPVESMIAEVQQQVKGATVSSVKIYQDPTRTVEIGYSDGKEKKEGREGGHGEGNAEKRPENHRQPNDTQAKTKGERGDKKGRPEKGGEGGGMNNNQAYVNPYTGELVSLSNQRSSFFTSAMFLHRWLLVREPGRLIVGISTSIFLFILITGIILWWPQTKKMIKQRLTLKWNAGWKRINHDLHIVVGFYTAIFLFAFAFTGLAWSFKWFNDGIYWVTGSENKRPEPPKSAIRPDAKPISLAQAFATIKKEVPQAEFYAINSPKGDSAAIAVTVMPLDAVHERASDQYFLDQYSGKLLGTNLYADRNLGQRVRATFYPIHVGSIGGLPGRIIAFISCLAGFTFPISGLILWLNRLRKNKKRKKPAGRTTKVVQ